MKAIVVALALTAAAFAQSAQKQEPQQCPVTFVKVDPIADRANNWDFLGQEGQYRKAGIHRNFLRVKAKNATDKTIVGMTLVAAYADASGDLYKIPITWEFTKTFGASKEAEQGWINEVFKGHAQYAYIVYPTAVQFSDNTTWRPSVPGQCFGAWYSRHSTKKYNADSLPLIKNMDSYQQQ